MPSGRLVKVTWRSCSIFIQTSSSSSYRPNAQQLAKRRLLQSAAHTVGLCCPPTATKRNCATFMPTRGPFLILRLTYWVWKGSSVNFVSEELPLLPATTTPLPTTLQPHSGQQWRQLDEKNDKLGFPRLENEDSHGIPMEQHSGEIESTTKHYTNTRTRMHTHRHTHNLHVHAKVHPSIVTDVDIQTQIYPSGHIILRLND